MKPQKYTHTCKTIQPWIDEHECIRVYLQRLNNNRRRTAVYLFLYCEWAGKSPEQLLSLKTSFESSEAERLLDRFTIAETVFPDCIKWLIINAVKAFYRVNYRQLQSAAGQFEYVPRKSHGVASKDTRLRLYRAGYTPRDRALVMASTCTAIARETLSELLWSHFEDGWQRQDVPCIVLPAGIVKGHGRGRYKGVRQVSFLTPEAKRVFVEYREWYAKTFGHVWKPADHVFLSTRLHVHCALTKEGLSRVMVRLTERAGVNFSIHDGRIIVQTALENVGAAPNWIKKIKGRKPRGEESPYSKPAIEQLREKYREALPELEFLGQASGEVEALRPEFRQVLASLARVLDRYPEKAEKFERFLMEL